MLPLPGPVSLYRGRASSLGARRWLPNIIVTCAHKKTVMQTGFAMLEVGPDGSR